MEHFSTIFPCGYFVLVFSHFLKSFSCIIGGCYRLNRRRCLGKRSRSSGMQVMVLMKLSLPVGRVICGYQAIKNDHSIRKSFMQQQSNYCVPVCRRSCLSYLAQLVVLWLIDVNVFWWYSRRFWSNLAEAPGIFEMMFSFELSQMSGWKSVLRDAGDQMVLMA